MNFSNHRQMNELSLVGSVLWENKYHEVSFLTPKNFHKWGHLDLPFIWSCMPGDIFEVSKKGRALGMDIAKEVLELTNYAVYSHIKPIALDLICEEFRNGFIITLETIIKKTDNPTQKSAATEVLIQMTDYSQDVFELIHSGTEYLNTFQNQFIETTLKEFHKRMNAKIDEIKKTEK